MKSILLAIALLATTVTFSQDNKKHQEKGEKLTTEQKAEKKANHLAEKLGLDDKQKAEVLAINLKAAKEHEAHRAEMKALREKMKSKREVHRSEIENVLTDEQKLKLKEIETKRKAKKAECKKGNCKPENKKKAPARKASELPTK